MNNGIIPPEIVGTPDDPIVIAMTRMKVELASHTRPRKVLFVEDQESMHALFDRWSSNFNCEVTYASDGETGCRLAKEGSFDLIILDIALPVMNGIDCFRCIRKELGDLPPITFFTGTLNDDQAREIEVIGFASFIRKPSQFNLRFITSFFHTFGIFKKPTDTTK